MNSLSENLLIRSSNLFKDFISLKIEEFDKVKNNYDKMKNPYYIKEYSDLEGKINVSINPNKDNVCDKILNEIKLKNNLFYNLQLAIKSYIDETKIMNEKLKNISSAFKHLSNSYSNSLNGRYLQKTFNSLDNLFLDWSKSYNNQMIFFNNEFLEFFRFMDNELQVFKSLDDNYSNQKKDYLKYKKQFDANLENAEVLMKIKGNFLMSKTMFGYYLNKYYDEYFRLNEVHSERLKKLIDKMNKQKDTYFSDMIKLVQLLSINK
jgi:hypothetical protein